MKTKTIICIGFVFTTVIMRSQVFFPALISREEVRGFQKTEAFSKDKETFDLVEMKNEMNIIKNKRIEEGRKYNPENPININEAFAQLNKSPEENFFISIGSGSGSPFAPIGIGTKKQLTRYKPVGKPGKGGIDPLYLYGEYKIDISSEFDSKEIRKQFLFPEINTNTFLAGLSWERYWNNGDYVLAGQAEGSLSKLRNDTTYFEYYGITGGIRFERRNLTIVTATTNNPANNGWFMVHLFYNRLNIENKFIDEARAVLEETKLPKALNTLGVTAAFGTLNQGVFVTAKGFFYPYGWNGSRVGDHVEFENYVITVGYRVYFTTGLLRLINWP